MKHTVMFVILLGALTFTLAPRGHAADTDKTELEGVWVLIAVEIDGEKKEAGKDTKSYTTGNSFVVKAGDKVVVAGTFKLDRTKKPKTIDVTYTEGPSKGQTIKGIYEVDGDTSKFCRAGTPDQERPTEFVTKPNTGALLAVYKREKK